MLFLWKSNTVAAGFKPETHAWLARQSGSIDIVPRPLLYDYYFHPLEVEGRVGVGQVFLIWDQTFANFDV